jgi:integrase
MGRDARLISPARVNRATVDILRAIYGRAKRVWKIPIATEPDWRQHRLKEPEERVRELEADEQTSIDSAAREGYDRLYRFARLSGLRLSACLLRKDDIKWGLGRIEVRSKGGKLNRVPLSSEIRGLLLEC